MILLLAACAGGDDTGSDTSACADAPQVTWESFGQGFFENYCRSCHSSTAQNRYGAPEGLDFDTEAQVQQYESLVRATVLEDASMPVGGGVFVDDLTLLEIYLDCGL